MATDTLLAARDFEPKAANYGTTGRYKNGSSCCWLPPCKSRCPLHECDDRDVGRRLVGSVTSAAGLLSGTGHYIHWGVVQISVANLVVIAVLVLLFVLALVLPFPGRRDGGSS